MFIPDADKTELRQGDVIAAVWFPRIKFADIRILAPVDRSNREQIVLTSEIKSERGMDWSVAQIQMTRRFVMVLSQCCDLERDKNSRARGLAAIMGPLVPIPEKYRNKPDAYAELRSNPIEKYVNMFFVERRDPLPSDFIVDFGRVVSIGLDQYEHLLEQKVLQLTDEMRVLLKSKLAFNFGRLTEEEEKAGYKVAVPGPTLEKREADPSVAAQGTDKSTPGA